MRRGAGTAWLAGGGLGLLLLAAASGRAKASAAPPRAPEGPHGPLPGRPTAGSGFGWRADPFTGQRAFHRGLDIPVPVGTPVFAPLAGEVVRVDRDGVGRGAINGNAVFIQTDRYVWIYLHLSAVAVRVGDRVSRGQIVGRTGQTGRATGPHLHVQVTDAGGQLVDPLTLIPDAVLARRGR